MTYRHGTVHKGIVGALLNSNGMNVSLHLKYKIVIAVLVGILCIFVWSLFDEVPITNYPPKNDTIVAFGDSLVFGQGATMGNNFVSVLSRLLDRPIVNLGVNGNTTTDGLLRVDEGLQEKPGIVILLLGGNDFIRNVADETIERNLSALIETFQKEGVVVVLLGVRSGIISNNGEAIYERLHKKYGTIFIPDVLEGVYLKPGLMSDGIHPNDAGYKKIAERVYKLFIKNKL